jgi:hypothetical protein
MPSLPSCSARSRGKRNRVVQKQFIALLGMVLCSRAAVAGQMSVPQLVPAQEQNAPIPTMHRALAIHLRAARFLLTQDPGRIPVHFRLVFGGDYEGDPILQHLSPMDEVKTLTLTQSLLPLVRLWGGRLQLDAFESTLHSQNLQFGASGDGGLGGFRAPRQGYSGGPFSAHFTGLSLSFHFGREARTRPAIQLWRHMTRVVGAVLN